MKPHCSRTCFVSRHSLGMAKEGHSVIRHPWIRLSLVVLAVGHCVPKRISAQRVLAPTLSARSLIDRPYLSGSQIVAPSDVHTGVWTLARATRPRIGRGADFAPKCRARGPIAVRGLAWGALIGGVVGYLSFRDEEYGGAIIGPVIGGAVGAPVGMVTLLLLTPFTPC